MEHTHSHHDPEESITSQSSEMAHRATVIATWDRYASASLSANNRRMKDFLALSTRQQALLPDYLDLLAEVRYRNLAEPISRARGVRELIVGF